MLKDELFLVVGLQHHRILVERPNPARQLDPADQVNGDGGFLFAGGVQKRILDVLRRLVIHLPISFILDYCD